MTGPTGRAATKSLPSTPHRVLLVDDEIGIRLSLADRLRVAGYEVETAEDGESALQLALKGGFDAILLDLILPKMDGVKLCEKLRSNGIDTAVLMLTVKSSLEDRVRGFVAGADDYMAKTTDIIELLARLQAVLRRTSPQTRPAKGAKAVREFGGVRVEFSDASVWRGSERIELSRKEYDLLCYFLAHPLKKLTRGILLEEIWRFDPSSPTRTVDVHVAALRRKLEKDPAHPRWIRTVRGVGYEFVPE